MTGKTVSDFSFKKCNQVKTLASMSGVKIDGEIVQIDPRLLFQRMISATNSTGEELTEVLKHELCTMPPSLFEPSGLLRQACKSTLAEVIWKIPAIANNATIPNIVTHVIDGGHLLHRLPWPRGSTYDDICSMYVKYVNKMYPRAIVVFDGYGGGPSTKDITHIRPIKGGVGVDVMFESNMIITLKKD